MGQFSKNSSPHGRARTRVGRLGLWSEPHVVSRLGSEMRVIANFQIIPRLLGRLGLRSGLGLQCMWVGYGQDHESWDGQGQES